jgi:hypothetical protein
LQQVVCQTPLAADGRAIMKANERNALQQVIQVNAMAGINQILRDRLGKGGVAKY